MSFKITKILFSIFILSLIACSNGHEGDTLQEARTKGYADITVLYLPAEGFAYFDENDQLTGVAIDIMQEFAEFVNVSNGIELRFSYEPVENFSEFYTSVRDGDGGVFGLGNVTITQERMQEIGFSPPYMTNVAVLITHDSVDELSSMDNIQDELYGLQGLAFQGTLHEARIENIRNTWWPDLEIALASSNTEILERVSSDPDYFAYIDVYNFLRALDRGMPLRQHSVADLASEQFGFILPLNSDWDTLLNDFFNHGKGFTRSRTYRNIMERHLGEELTYQLLAAERAMQQ